MWWRLWGVIALGGGSLAATAARADMTQNAAIRQVSAIPVCEAALLLTHRGDSFLNESESRTRSLKAISAIRNFRQSTLELNNDIPASTRAVVANSRGNENERFAVGQRLRGLELNLQEMPDESVGASSDFSQGITITGHENIRDVLALLQEGPAASPSIAFASQVAPFLGFHLKLAAVLAPTLGTWLYTHPQDIHDHGLGVLVGLSAVLGIQTLRHLKRAVDLLPRLLAEKAFEKFKLEVLDSLNRPTSDPALESLWSFFSINSESARVNTETKELLSLSWLGVDFLLRFREVDGAMTPELLVFSRSLKDPKKNYPKKPRRREEQHEAVTTPLFDWGEPELVPVPVPVPARR